MNDRGDCRTAPATPGLLKSMLEGGGGILNFAGSTSIFYRPVVAGAILQTAL